MLLLLLLALLLGTAAAEEGGGNNTVVIKDDPGEQIPGPAHPGDPASVDAWRSAMLEWRSRMREKIHYNGSIFVSPANRYFQYCSS